MPFGRSGFTSRGQRCRSVRAEWGRWSTWCRAGCAVPLVVLRGAGRHIQPAQEIWGTPNSGVVLREAHHVCTHHERACFMLHSDRQAKGNVQAAQLAPSQDCKQHNGEQPNQLVSDLVWSSQSWVCVAATSCCDVCCACGSSDSPVEASGTQRRASFGLLQASCVCAQCCRVLCGLLGSCASCRQGRTRSLQLHPPRRGLAPLF